MKEDHRPAGVETVPPDRRGLPLVLELARRRSEGGLEGSALSDMLSGKDDGSIATGRGLPLATVRGIRSFYEQIEPIPRACAGTACYFAGGKALAAELRARGPLGEVRCLGHCHAAPTAWWGGAIVAGLHSAGAPGPKGDPPSVLRTSLSEPAVVLRNICRPSTGRDWREEYHLPSPAEILAALEKAGLRGRGGAAFPTAAKWMAARDTPASERYVVANGDEGDPGSFADRVLMEEAPHAILAGMSACARVIGSRRGLVYVRAEYPRARERMVSAILEARGAGLLGEQFDAEVVSGAGSYVCGEESALLSSIEGLRGEPRPRPPYPAQRGLHGLPTVVQNVETLVVVPQLARHGGSKDTKAVSLSGAVARPGLVEAPFGISFRRILEEGGGGPAPGRRWKMALVGGPMGRVLPERLFDTPLSYDALPGMGHGGVVVLDDTVSARDLARHLFGFARAESCGSCSPCRIGTARLESVAGRKRLERLLQTMEMGSLCGFGQGVPRPIRDLLVHYPREVFR